MARVRTRAREPEKKNAREKKGAIGGSEREAAEAPTVITDWPKVSKFKGVRNRYVDAVEGVTCQLRTELLDSLVPGPIVIRSEN